MNRFGNNYDNYTNNMAFQCSTNMCIMQIGELTTKLSEEFKEKNNVVPWRLIRATRNITAHDYEKIDFKHMWQTLIEDIPKLKTQLTDILEEANATNEKNNNVETKEVVK